MKKITIAACFATFLAFGSCGGNQGSDTTSTDTKASDSSASNSANATTTDTTSARMSANTASKDTGTSGDQPFVLDAASGGLMEVELGKIAATNASSAKVKEFGRMMVADHTKANAELKAVAAKKNITVPPAPAEKQQAHIDELKAKKGADFDQAYTSLMLDDHKEDVSKFQDEAKNGKDPDIKAFASKTLPVLNKHLQHVQMLESGMKK